MLDNSSAAKCIVFNSFNSFNSHIITPIIIMITLDQLKSVKDRTEQLHRYLDIDGKKIQYEEEQLRTQAPGFWDDQKRAEAQMKLVKGLEKWLKGYAEVKTLCDELDTAFEFYKEELVTEDEVDAIYAKAITAIEELELKNMLRREEDSMDAVLKINSGAGGTEAQDWAQMLMRMSSMATTLASSPSLSRFRASTPTAISRARIVSIALSASLPTMPRASA